MQPFFLILFYCESTYNITARRQIISRCNVLRLIFTYLRWQQNQMRFIYIIYEWLHLYAIIISIRQQMSPELLFFSPVVLSILRSASRCKSGSRLPCHQKSFIYPERTKLFSPLWFILPKLQTTFKPLQGVPH